MTKSILIDRLCVRRKVPAGRAEQIVNAVFEAMEQALKRDERIEIRGLGSFEVRHYKGYVGRNPRTGSSVAVKPKRLPFFKVGKELKSRVDQIARDSRRPGRAPARNLDRANDRAPDRANDRGNGVSARTSAPADQPAADQPTAATPPV